MHSWFRLHHEYTRCARDPYGAAETTRSPHLPFDVGTIQLFWGPVGIAVDQELNVYNTNCSNNTITKTTPAGQTTVFAQHIRFQCPNAHITFANGRLYVCAWQGNQIFEVTLEGDVSLLAGDGASGRDDGSFDVASFNQPNGIDASRTGDTLYVNDTVPISSAGRLLHPNVVRMITGVGKSRVQTRSNNSGITRSV